MVFDGDDLADVAAAVGLPADGVVALMVDAELEVAFVGFAPGFPYLTGLPPELAALPRRATPRTSVPAGSVAVAGGFAAVYPRATPGGWHLLGRTSETLFDPDVPPHTRVAPGDRVRFVVADGAAASPVAARPTPTGARSSTADGPLPRGPRARTRHHRPGRRPSRARPPRGAGRRCRRPPVACALSTCSWATRPMPPSSSARRPGPTLRMVGDGHLAVVGRPGPSR